MLSSIFEKFVKESPVSVMAPALMSHIFATERIDGLFGRNAQVQYQQDLLFSSLVDLMSLVVCGMQKSVHAAYKARAGNLSVSTTAMYNKLCGVELRVSQALVRETAQDLEEESEISRWRTSKYIARVLHESSGWDLFERNRSQINNSKFKIQN